MSIETTPIFGVSPTLQIMISAVLFETHGADLSSAWRSERCFAVIHQPLDRLHDRHSGFGYQTPPLSRPPQSSHRQRPRESAAILPLSPTASSGPIVRPRRFRWTAAMSQSLRSGVTKACCYKGAVSRASARAPQHRHCALGRGKARVEVPVQGAITSSLRRGVGSSAMRLEAGARPEAGQAPARRSPGAYRLNNPYSDRSGECGC